jgi:hypothetical protein
MSKSISRAIALIIPLAATLLLIVCGDGAGGSDGKELSQEQLIERGRHLVVTGDCGICHSPKVFDEARGLPVEDSSRLLSGHPADLELPEIPADLFGPGMWGTLANDHMTAWVGPWGVSFATNLTPHNLTGSGAWTEEAFIKAMRTGKHLGRGRQILPPMPWQAIGKNTDQDLKAMFAYLQSIEPIDNRVPQPLPPDKLPGRSER